MLHYRADANILGLTSRAFNQLDPIFGNFFADINAKGNAHQVSILELYPWPFVPVV